MKTVFGFARTAGSARSLIGAVALVCGLTLGARASDKARPERLPPVPAANVPYYTDADESGSVAAPVVVDLTIEPPPVPPRPAMYIPGPERVMTPNVGVVPPGQPTAFQPAAPASPSDQPNDQPATSESALAPVTHGDVIDGYCDGYCDLPYGLTLQVGIEQFRNRADVAVEDNYGAKFGGNLGLPFLPDDHIGIQLGATHGIYDWKGRFEFNTDPSATQPMQQTFITVGLFHNCNCDPCDIMGRFSWGVVYDWMIADNYGRDSVDVVTGQLRAQIGYACDERNEIGFAGMIGDRTAADLFVGNTYAPMSRLDVFWQHKFESGASLRTFVGVPDGRAPAPRVHRTLNWVAGASVSVPVSAHWAFFGQTTYGHPNSPSGGNHPYRGGHQEMLNQVLIGFEFNANGFSNSVCDCPWTPYLPVAHNGNFVTDASFDFVGN